MRHIIFGGKGFLGSNMLRYIGKTACMASGDFRDYKDVVSQIEEGDYVWNFAANMGGIGYFSEANYYPVLDNYLIDINILNACEEKGASRLFYPSSACAYNTDFMNQGAELEEAMLDWPAKPDQMYGWEKLTMIKLMRNSPVDCRVGVLHTIYGEGQEYEGKKAKFPPQMAYKAVCAVKTGEIAVWGDGTQTRTFLYVDDAIKKMHEVMMLKRYHGEVNIGSDKEVSINDVVNVCCNILKIKPKINYEPDKPTGPSRRLCSNEKFNRYYKVKEKVDLKEGFKRLINYIKRREDSC